MTTPDHSNDHFNGDRPACEEPEDLTPSKQYWQCQECGYEDHAKAMPKDRQKFYSKESPKCPKCKSVGFVPVGY